MNRHDLPIVVPFLILAACAGGTARIGAIEQSPTYDASLVHYATRSGTMTVIVRGSPFGAGGDGTAPTIAALSPPGWLGSIRFVPSTVAEETDDYRLVLVFGAGFGQPCDGLPAQPGPPTAAAMHVQASFCAGRQVLSTLVADGSPANSATDPGFRRFMAEVIATLLPASNADRYYGSGGGGGGGGGGM